ncbi:protein BUNDLE SHEATH DEFECTIVE 2, chloroplastic-like isoform X2 [Argentina anserina]|uniref:protein BUNDLE SHEATH DEFECTIVE 2, chloroplastic-like isoform X2 n=1 Tax=Argentina anserina TaxID=57926 RepID=UPI0021766CEA|nr:protein BUNDLE SHEATH DEFECTIVE 2, chloroplastic-like isoform X2 [Potentilla anserina]
MATSSLCLTQICSFKSSNKPGVLIGNLGGSKVLRVNEAFQNSKSAKTQSWEIKATDGKPTTKVNSIVCSDCEGNGAKACSQCKGTGVNSEDHFNGQFKAGGLCWLCREFDSLVDREGLRLQFLCE